MKYGGICEMYPCLQGEGTRAGIPSLMIRTAGCNLHCVWCDTGYAQRKSHTAPTEKDVYAFLEKHPEINDVIISGGEPTICYCINRLIGACFAKGKFITMETNGMYLLPPSIMSMIDLISLSPKMSNSVPLNDVWREMHNREERVQPKVLRAWIAKAMDYQMKFVVKLPKDLEEIDRLVALLDVPKTKVFLMPQGATDKELYKKREWLADMCLSHGYRYCERIHIVIYGKRRRV